MQRLGLSFFSKRKKNIANVVWCNSIYIHRVHMHITTDDDGEEEITHGKCGYLDVKGGGSDNKAGRQVARVNLSPGAYDICQRVGQRRGETTEKYCTENAVHESRDEIPRLESRIRGFAR